LLRACSGDRFLTREGRSRRALHPTVLKAPSVKLGGGVAMANVLAWKWVRHTPSPCRL
jgi:hypothetical protein